jgi:hypothetical protein
MEFFLFLGGVSTNFGSSIATFCMNSHEDPPYPGRLGSKRVSATTTKPPTCLINAFILVLLHRS